MVNFIPLFILGSRGKLYHLGVMFRQPTMASKINVVMSSSVSSLQNCLFWLYTETKQSKVDAMSESPITSFNVVLH